MFGGQTALKPDLQPASPTEEPTDTISSIVWSNQEFVIPSFATSCWDSFVRIYQVDIENQKMSQTKRFQTSSPSLCVNWHLDKTKVFAGCASGAIEGFDVESGTKISVGEHSGPVKSVYWLESTDNLCSLSFDSTIKFWDLRQKGHVGEIQLKYKPLCSDLYEYSGLFGAYLLMGMSEGKLALVDVADMQKGKEKRFVCIDSPLGERSPLTCVKVAQDYQRFALGSIDGRCEVLKRPHDNNVENGMERVIRWKAHGKNQENSDAQIRSPVTSMFHVKQFSDCVGTCGDDRLMYWNTTRREMIREHKLEGNVTCAELSDLFTDEAEVVLAYSTGVDWHRGISEYMTQRSSIRVRIMPLSTFF